MNKTNRIRLYFALGAVLCCAAYRGGYYLMHRQPMEELQPGPAPQQEPVEPEKAVESGSVVLPYEYILKAKDGYVVVYYADGETVYDDTSIRLEHLPGELRQEIEAGKQIRGEAELYNFLESYSS